MNAKNISVADISNNNINAKGSITFNGNLNIDNPSGNKFVINGIDIRDYVIGCTLSSVDINTPEYADGGNGGSRNFTVGKWSFCDAGISDLANNIIVNPGFGVKLWTNCKFNSDNQNNTTEYGKIENKDNKPARVSFRNSTLILDTAPETGVSAGLYTHKSELVTITNTSTQTFADTVSSIEVYKL